MTSDSSGLFERGQALVVGVGSYGDPRWDAPIASQDAATTFATLVDQDLGGYSRGRAELLLDKDATKAGILAALRRLAHRCRPDDVALISFTCHGALSDDGLYYLAASDTRFSAPPQEQIASGSGIHVGALAQALREIPARQLLLIINACFAGHLGGVLGQGGVAPEYAGHALGAMLPDYAGNMLLATGEGRAIITAGRPGQLSYFQLDERHSYFGQALIDALRGEAASAPRGYIGLYELYESVYRKVRDVTTRRLGVVQEPVLTLLQGVGPFPVARSSRAAGGSAVSVRKSAIIDFGGATVMGGVKLNDVASGSIVKVGQPDAGAPAEERSDPLRDLQILRERVAAARNVDEDARDDAAMRLAHAHRALSQSDGARARQRLDDALGILRSMDNGYIRSIVRKLEALRTMI